MLTRLIEGSIEVQKVLFICFIDYSKLFDKVRHDDLFKIMHEMHELGIGVKDLRL